MDDRTRKTEIIMNMVMNGYDLGRHPIDWYVNNFSLAIVKEFEKNFFKYIKKG